MDSKYDTEIIYLRGYHYSAWSKNEEESIAKKID